MTEQSRRYNLYQLLVVCRENKWTIDTPDIAGKLEAVLASSGYTERTIRDYVRTAISMLEYQKKRGIDLVLKYELESLGPKRPSDKTAKRKAKAKANPIYSSPVIPSNGGIGKNNPESPQSPNFVYIK